jgi:hypothetical protein
MKYEKELGAILHQQMNTIAIFQRYCEFWRMQVPDKNLANIFRQGENAMIRTVDALCVALKKPDLKKFSESKINQTDRITDLMRILEVVSRLDEKSIELVADQLEAQITPVLENENEEIKTIIHD